MRGINCMYFNASYETGIMVLFSLSEEFKIHDD